MTTLYDNKSGADRKAKSLSKRSQCMRREPEDQERRDRLEADPLEWMKWYLSETYTRPFETPHIKIIAGAMDAHKTSGRFAVAAERGIGKSAILWGLVLYLSMTGKQRFPVCVPWAASARKRAFKFWKNALCYNPRLDADYPEFTEPFKVSKGISQRIIVTTWANNEEPTGAQLAIGEGLIVFPSELGCIGGETINGNIRGLNHPLPGGGVLRPSLVLLDDVQNRKVAKSEIQVLDTVAMIDGDVAGCGDAGRDLPMLMACNCICAEDVSGHYLNSSEWNGLRVPCIEEWPNGWEEEDGPVRKLWQEWHELYTNDDEDDRPFYEKHRAEMTEGMKLTAPSVFDGGGGVDAFYSVMVSYFKMGHDAFWAERQQAPIDPYEDAGPYKLTADIIQSRTDIKRKKYSKPSWVTYTVATTDLNPSYAFTTIILGFGPDQTCAILWYGLHKVNIKGQKSTPERDKQLHAELSAHGKQLAKMPFAIDDWAIDAGGAQFDSVSRFALASGTICGINARAYRGQGHKRYNPNTAKTDGTAKECVHRCLDKRHGRTVRWFYWDADYWKEIAQRAWLGEIGAPGSIDLYNGQHAEFASQVSCERLIAKDLVGELMVWDYRKPPSDKNDYGDALAQGYACAAFYGIGTGGSRPRVIRRLPQRKAK